MKDAKKLGLFATYILLLSAFINYSSLTNFTNAYAQNSYKFELSAVPNDVSLDSPVRIEGKICPNPVTASGIVIGTDYYITKPDGSIMTDFSSRLRTNYCDESITIGSLKADMIGKWSVHAIAQWSSGDSKQRLQSNTFYFSVREEGFTIDIESTQLTLYQGENKQLTVSVNTRSQRSHIVDLDISDMPQGTSYNFNPSTGTAPFTSALTLTARSNASPGQYTITLTGTSDNFKSTEKLILNVSRKLIDAEPLPLILIDSHISQKSVAPGKSFSGSYVIFNPNNFSVSAGLGLSIRPSGNYSEIFDSKNDMIVSVLPGKNTYSRSFEIPSLTTSGSYDVKMSIWSKTPQTSTLVSSTNWLTNMLGVQDFDFSISVLPNSGSVLAGGALALAGTVSVNVIGGPQTVSLSLTGLPSVVGMNDLRNRSCSSKCSINFAIETLTGAAPGVYNLTITGAGGGKIHSATYILTLTESESPSVPIAEPTPAKIEAVTITGSTISSTSVRPMEPLTITYEINNPTSQKFKVWLGAVIRHTNTDTLIDDRVHDIAVSATPGIHTYSREFIVPSWAVDGTYDYKVSIWDAKPPKGNQFYVSQVSNDVFDVLLTEAEVEEEETESEESIGLAETEVEEEETESEESIGLAETEVEEEETESEEVIVLSENDMQSPKLITDTLELNKGETKTYMITASRALIVKVAGLENRSFGGLIKNSYEIKVYRNDQLVETVDSNLSLLNTVGDPAKIEIILPEEPLDYRVDIMCKDIGSLFGWTNGNKVDITIFSSSDTVKSASSLHKAYDNAKRAWTEQFTYNDELLSWLLQEPNNEGEIRSNGVSAVSSAVNFMFDIPGTEVVSTIVETLRTPGQWSPVWHAHHEYMRGAFDRTEYTANVKELDTFYSKSGCSASSGIGSDFVTSQLECITYLYAKIENALVQENYVEAQEYMELQNEFSNLQAFRYLLGWFSSYELPESSPYYSVFQKTKSVIMQNKSLI
jgi:hypothetical protein